MSRGILRREFRKQHPVRGVFRPAERPCLVCGKPHRNNQPFCSAECCAKHKVVKR